MLGYKLSSDTRQAIRMEPRLCVKAAHWHCSAMRNDQLSGRARIANVREQSAWQASTEKSLSCVVKSSTWPDQAHELSFVLQCGLE